MSAAGRANATNQPEDADTGAAATPTNTPEPGAPQTKTIVWKDGDFNHARIVDPDNHGVSREYRWDRDNGHEVVMDEADAAILMAGPDKNEFRMKRS